LQGLTAQQVGDQGAPSLLELSDARLVTVFDPEAPPTIPQAEWPVRLFLGGFRFAEWLVTFESPVDSFDLDGLWAAFP
jgi:hypothetical protein